ncbi:long-chain-fatty-acid--CoA ligase [Chondromyces apiculatus]|uniref:Long-chain-fatty-acid--CoA ligase n=1 Tax=Chondromyces apiculatus DSM 436 TaxID=1192034 RepID=A0A017TF24_9BACT|nr:long-chain-fatty-acid--CoA ligase [Chondromyces apiculatus]EYF07502.1 Long-chain-fatty-acid--CoA ligase [Chondromyces apiculatus DSM 436]
MQSDAHTTSTLASVIRTHAAERPGAVALIQDDEAVTYKELHARSNRVAQALQACGIGPADRVAFLDKNGIAYFELLFGAAKLNAVLVAINWRLTPREVEYIVNDAEATVFVFGAEYADMAAALARELKRVKKFVVIGANDRFEPYARWRDAAGSTDPGIEAAGSDIAFHVYSSGTTGHPKGVMLSHDNLFSLLPASSANWKVDASSVNMVALPVFHIGGCGWAMVGMFNGCTSVIVRDVQPAALIDLIGKHRITHAFLVPVLLHVMQLAPNAARGDYSSLKLVVYGAAPISEEVLGGAVKLLGCGFAQAYGLTETTGAIVTLPPEDHDLEGLHRHRLRAAGKPHAGVEVKIVAPQTGEELPVGTPGEIWTRSRQNMVGYWRLEGDSATSMTGDGWLKTGDIGYFDGDGYLYIHDRLKDMIITGGENVYPAEVENVLMKHETVADVAVIGIPSEKWGESPLAVVVPVKGAVVNEKDLLAFARKYLAGFKVPVGIELRAELPRTPSGKVLKKDLRAHYWEGCTRAIN